MDKSPADNAEAIHAMDNSPADDAEAIHSASAGIVDSSDKDDEPVRRKIYVDDVNILVDCMDYVVDTFVDDKDS